jgi:protein-S-isoprenylcysteine O-methyltransferase Ste14
MGWQHKAHMGLPWLAVLGGVAPQPTLVTFGLQTMGWAWVLWALACLPRNPLPAKALQTQGPYAWVRHPMYTGYALWVGGLLWAISPAGWVGALNAWLWAWLVFASVLRLQKEEADLHQRFGQAYLMYCQQTPWRLCPWVF